MDDLEWESARSSEGIASLVGRGRVLLATTIALMALFAYLGVQQSSTTAAHSRATTLDRRPRALKQIGADQGLVKTRFAIDPAFWDDTIAQFPTMVQGAALTKVREIGSQLAGNSSQLWTPSIQFQIDIVESTIEDNYAFKDGRLLLTSGLVSRLETPGQVAAVLSQMMERVVAARNPARAVQPWSQLAVALSAGSGYDPRAIVWLIDEQARRISPQSPHAAERLRLLRLKSAQASAEIAAAFPAGLPQKLIQ